MSEYNYNSSNNYNYDNNSGDMPGFGYDSFGPEAGSYQGDFGSENYQQPVNIGPVGLDGLKTLITQKVVAKSFMFMVVALIITAIASMITSPATAIKMMSGGSFFILLIVEIAIVLISNSAIKKNNAILAGALYTAYSFITGMTFSVLIYAYTGSSLAATFFVTAGMFGIMAIIGLTTDRDLTGIGSICLMGLVGIILAGIVNIFILRNSMFDLILSIIGVVIFVGLTAYDTQKIKQMSLYSTAMTENSLALFGAFQLYLDFINLFLRLLRIMGRRR
ncbi:MAG: Bax inhibitor-1/YccA family protein [Lachnospiraceae bacterium]|nr:Bax inhibitor-1/YccA family protein [Lachnospiraceae bacterium]